MKLLLERTYTAEVFGSQDITPVKTLEPGLHLLALSNGPTLAFKDLAMQFLGHLFEYVLSRSGAQLNILGATSGDTGSAAEYAMRGKRGVRVFMLSPYGKMSPFQTAQMYSLQDANIFNLGVRGVFDDCQDIVKAVSNDAAFKARYRIGAVNSINWARVVAQVVYYFKGYLAVAEKVGDPVSFAVPSGNFGNIFAGYIARQMGLPIHKLILATNENDVLDEFFRTGRYRVRTGAEVQQTSSPSMDISKASNFERYIYDLTGRDPGKVVALWRKIDVDGGFDLSGPEFSERISATGLVSGRRRTRDRLETIRRVYRRYGVMIDTHTADGLKVGLEHREPGIPLVCLETALPAKFAATIREALGRDPDVPPGFEGLEGIPQRVEVIDAMSKRLNPSSRATATPEEVIGMAQGFDDAEPSGTSAIAPRNTSSAPRRTYFSPPKPEVFKPGSRARHRVRRGSQRVWLAQHGCEVVAIDISPVAIEKARRLAGTRASTSSSDGGRARLAVAPEAFDAVVSIFIQFAAPAERGRLFGGFRTTLRPGGVLVLQGYTPKQLQYKTGGPPEASTCTRVRCCAKLSPGWRSCICRSTMIHGEGTKHVGRPR